MWRTNFTFSRAVLLLSWLLNTINAIESGKLGIAWNPQLLLQPEDSPRAKWGWTSIVEFEDDVQASLSNEEIVGIAIIARKDMQRDFKKKPWQEAPYNQDDPPFAQEPTVMTVIVLKNRMYFGSSVKGDRETLAFTASGNKDVREALIACQKANEGKEHLNKANCGEPMAAHIAFESGLASLAGAKVVTVDKSKVRAPCGVYDDNGEATLDWGCNKFIPQLGLDLIPDSTSKADVAGVPNPKVLAVCL